MSPTTPSRIQARLRRALFTTATLLVAFDTNTAFSADDLAAALAHPGSGRTVERSVSLADLGIREPIVLRAPDSREELYLPVPAGLPISDATLQLDGGYLRGDGGRTSMLMSLDGSPVLARSFTQPQGDAAESIGVDGSPRSSGFVRVGLQWSSILNTDICTDQTAIGNVLRVTPATRLTYRFDPDAVTDVRTAASALPLAPVVMLGARKVTASTFDAGWRAEALLQREAKKPLTQTWPVAGDTVNLSGAEVPAPLRVIPAFGALAAGGTHRLADSAEAGALVMLAPEAAFAPDVIVVDDTLRDNVKVELDALREQITSVSPAAATAFDAWRDRTIAPIVAPLAAGEVRLVHLASHVAIVVGDKNGVAALARTWVPIDVANRLVVHQLDGAPQAHGDEIALASLGGEPRTLDVRTLAAWDMSFDLAAASADGKLPDDVVLDVAAAPATNGNGQIASLYFNDALIGSQLLDTNGKPQRITAHVPHYVLAPTNLLRVVFQREPDAHCAIGQGYPVAVLPTSHLTMREARVDDDFTGMVARFASEANVFVPATYLDDATATLPRVARLANAVDIAPTRGTLSIASDGGAVTPKGPFLAVDVALQDEAGRAKLSQDRMTLTDASSRVLADVSGMTRIALIETAKSGSTPGIVYRTAGASAPVLPATLRLSRGDVAIVGSDGLLKVFDTLHPGGVVPADGGFAQDPQRWLRWVLPGGLAVLFLVLLVLAGYARRRHQDKS